MDRHRPVSTVLFHSTNAI